MSGNRLLYSCIAAVGVLALAGLAVLFSPYCRRDNAYSWKLRNLHIALQSYSEVYSELPPLVVTRGGEPLYSWRVPFGPWAEELEQWPQFVLTAPWNSKENDGFRELPSAMTYGYDTSNAAKFLFVTGHGTGFDRNEHIRLLDDLPVDAIYMIECPESSIHWLEPGDFNIDSSFAADASVANVLNTRVASIYVMFADGVVTRIATRAPYSLLRACMLRKSASREARKSLVTGHACK